MIRYYIERAAVDGDRIFWIYKYDSESMSMRNIYKSELALEEDIGTSWRMSVEEFRRFFNNTGHTFRRISKREVFLIMI